MANNSGSLYSYVAIFIITITFDIYYYSIIFFFSDYIYITITIVYTLANKVMIHSDDKYFIGTI